MEKGIKSIMDALSIRPEELPLVFGLYHHVAVLAGQGYVDLARVQVVLTSGEIKRYRRLLDDAVGPFNDRVVNEASEHSRTLFVPRRKRGEGILDPL